MAAKRQAKIEDLFGKSKKIQKRDESEASSDTQTCEPVVAASTQPSERTHDPRDDGETVGETVTAAAVVSSAMSDDDSVVKIDASDAEKKKGKKRRFQKEWLQKYSWLRFSPEKNAMFCSICSDRAVVNPFTTGCQNWRTSTLQRHVASAEHRQTVRDQTAEANMARILDKAMGENEKAILSAIKTVYFMAKCDIPNAKYAEMLEFLKFQGRRISDYISVQCMFSI